MPFALTQDPTSSELSEAVNYLLSNFSVGFTVDPVTGEVVSNNSVVGYLYKYIAVKYADSADGSVNFSDVPTNRTYFGVRNSNSAAESANPADYLWQQAAGGFGVTKFLWYQTTGGRQIQFAVASAAPDIGWLQDPNISIDLDVVTSGNIPVIAEQFFSYFTPSVLFVPRTGSPLAPVFTNVIPSSPAYIEVPIRYKNNIGVVTQASIASLQLLFADPGADGLNGPTVDISGYTGFNQNAGGAFTPANATLSAIAANVTSPTYSWAITGATPTSSIASSVFITPNSSATTVTVTLTVNGSNLVSPISNTIQMPVVYDGAAGAAGANGYMSAFPSIYLWTGSSVPPTRPSTTSTFTWASGSYSAPSGWSTTVPSNTVAGNYLWEITIPLNVIATTVTSALDWTNVSYPIRAIAFNGNNGINGTSGTNGSATFVVTRVANDSSPPTSGEVFSIVGRSPVGGDICTVSYNNFNNAVVYRYISSWVLFQTYITGSLIVQNTITGDKIAANTITADRLTVANLAAISADLGSINAGSLNINNKFIVATDGTTTIQSATTGARVQIFNNVIKVYDSAGILRVKMGDLLA
jgi:hypothetical protein